MTHFTPSPSTPSEPGGEEALRIALLADKTHGQVSVDAESFIALNIWMGQQLQGLEDRFAHFQTPRTVSRRRNTRA